jgi:hypothetical protein
MRVSWVMTALIICAPVMAQGARHQAAHGKGDIGGLSKARKSILSELKDPGSAQFRDVRKGTDEDRARICGQVNSKNGYGGYVGFQKFVYFPDSDESVILDDDFVSPSYAEQQAKLFGSCFR